MTSINYGRGLHELKVRRAGHNDDGGGGDEDDDSET